jgi:hypothetical protein
MLSHTNIISKVITYFRYRIRDYILRASVFLVSKYSTLILYSFEHPTQQRSVDMAPPAFGICKCEKAQKPKQPTHSTAEGDATTAVAHLLVAMHHGADAPNVTSTSGMNPPSNDSLCEYCKDPAGGTPAHSTKPQPRKKASSPVCLPGEEKRPRARGRTPIEAPQSCICRGNKRWEAKEVSDFLRVPLNIVEHRTTC